MSLPLDQPSLGSAKPQAAFAEGIERPPEQTVEQSYQNAHDGDAEHDARKIAGFRGLGDVGTEPRGGEMGVAPACDFGDNGSVPSAAGGGDGAGDVVGEDAGQHDLDPPSPAVQMQA